MPGRAPVAVRSVPKGVDADVLVVAPFLPGHVHSSVSFGERSVSKRVEIGAEGHLLFVVRLLALSLHSSLSLVVNCALTRIGIGAEVLLLVALFLAAHLRSSLSFVGSVPK